MKNKNENQNYRVIITANDIVISFITNSKEIEDRLRFLFRGIRTPEKLIYDENGFTNQHEFNEKIIVAVVDNNLDSLIFPLSEHKKYIGNYIDEREAV